ncbi:hypothetical protein BCV69DRAFT_280428 [Microstroma glucosiphilum]|uniref:Cation/H+ exchanger transmembrane domain-containing protein n=1 Tax=Pseudomicrostroma glucosiphilum TaxID=1684307 RepID=A0A316UCE6_9BASI|nr:hypothetical protein BCV69DRAFT_280428 [Pseudomicrostroma glucosiphilum]PWN22822.1 hypothetical protein BCV69DRAFT_280428 [Pseudomicrostroma glucosiphilum]
MAVDSVLSGVDPTVFSISDPIRLFIIQATIIIILSRILAVLLRKINQPAVIAEVIGGILLGPTAMGRIPGFTKHIFPPASLSYLNLVATLGLVLFLFIVGLEVDLRSVTKNIKASVSISVVGMIVPFGLGAAISRGIYNNFINAEAVSFGHFLLFSGVAMSITAFPVLARILTETKLLYTNVGVTVLAAGVGNDIVGWVLLALTVALVNASTGVIAVYILLCAVGWALVLFLLIKPAFIWLARRTGSFEHGPTQLMVTLTLLLVLISAWLTDIIGVHPIFGAFLVGLMVPHDGGYAVAMLEKVEDLVSILFLPIYFGLSGLNTNLATLNTGLAWGYAIALIVVAFFSKFGGCAGTAKLCGFSWRESSAIGTLMSCKGLVELIVLNIGLSAGVLNTLTFSMFVLMAVISTLITTPLVLWIYPEKYRKSQIPVGASGHENEVVDDKEAKQDDWAASQSLLSTRKLMVVLTGFEHLPSLMNLVQLIRPSSYQGCAVRVGEGIRQRNVARKSVEGGEHESVAVEDSDDSMVHDKAGASSYDDHVMGAKTFTAKKATSSFLNVDALRLVELTDRTSAVMRMAESDDTLRADPISNVFRTFASLNRIPIRTSLSVVGVDYFPSTVVSRARDRGADLVILPWTIPTMASGQPQQQQQQDTDMPASSSFAGALSSPFGHIFGGAASGASQASSESDAQALMRNASQYAGFARRLIQSAECDVGLLVDRHNADHLAPRDSFTTVPAGKGILLGFMGGPDDRVALDLLTRFAAINEDLRVTVLRLKRVSADESGEVPLPEMPATIHSASHTRSLTQMQALTIQDTLYQRSAGVGTEVSPLEATLQDDLAFRALEGHLPSLSGRVKVREITTSRPLRDLIVTVQEEQPSLVLVGRGRKSPTMGSHRDELRVLLTNGVGPTSATIGSSGSNLLPPSEGATRAANSETCKVVGEVAMALTSLAKSSASVLVVAASNKSSAARAAGGETA